MRGACAILVSTWLAGTACTVARPGANTNVPTAARASASLIHVPFHAQEKDLCGPAALAMTLSWSGLEITPTSLVDEVFTPAREGSTQHDIVAATRRRDRVAYPIRGRDELHTQLAAGIPVLVLQNLGLTWLPRWHYAVVIGRDSEAGTLFLHTGREPAREMDENVFWRTWTRAGGWGLLTLPPDRLPPNPDERRFIEAIVGLETARRYEAAKQGYAAAVEHWPESVTARIGLANTKYASGDWPGAEATLREAVSRHPDSGAAWNNLAQVLAERGKTVEAIAAARRALAIGGPDVDVYRATLVGIR